VRSTKGLILKNMDLRKALSFILVLTATNLQTQVITGVVSDRKSNEPLPYVHIGVVGKNLGVISRDDGSYEIDLTPAGRTDVFAFSIIGYETQQFIVQDLRPGKMDIRLSPRTYELKEVIVRSKNEKPNTEKLGRFTPTKTTTGQSGMKEFGFGGERGLRINHQGKKYFVNQVSLHMRFNTVDSILFRINMYRVENDMPGESILGKEIFITSKKKQKWITGNVEKMNIVMDQDLIVTYEVVRIWFARRGENRLFFTNGSGYEEGRRYFRSSSQDAWTVDQGEFITLYITAEEY
jgi:hypothetical protein